MLDYEKLGAFYIGKRVDDDSGKLTDELVLYDSKDLTTHAVIIGMTGSGKTRISLRTTSCPGSTRARPPIWARHRRSLPKRRPPCGRKGSASGDRTARVSQN
jgi:hypothetical protein